MNDTRTAASKGPSVKQRDPGFPQRSWSTPERRASTVVEAATPGGKPPGTQVVPVDEAAALDCVPGPDEVIS